MAPDWNTWLDWAAEQDNEPETVLNTVSEKVGGFGVEFIQDNYGEFVSYVNMGDPYETTLYFDPDDDSYHVGAWGDLVESDGDRFGESEEDEDEEDWDDEDEDEDDGP